MRHTAAVAAAGSANHGGHRDLAAVLARGEQRFGAVELAFEVVDQGLLARRGIGAGRDRIDPVTGVADHGFIPERPSRESVAASTT